MGWQLREDVVRGASYFIDWGLFFIIVKVACPVCRMSKPCNASVMNDGTTPPTHTWAEALFSVNFCFSYMFCIHV